MKKRAIKTVVICVSVLLLLAVCFFCNAFFGNPVSKLMARHNAQKYLQSEFYGTDYEIERVSYDLKTGCYNVYIFSPISQDSSFTVNTNMIGRILYNDYKLRVNDRWNTAQRLDTQYRKQVDNLLEKLKYNVTLGYGTLEFDVEEGEALAKDAVRQSDLELDKIYNIQEIARTNGHLVVYIDSDNISLEKASEILLEIKKLCDENKIKFYKTDFTLQNEQADGTTTDDNRISLRGFLYDDICEDNLLDKVKKSYEETHEYFKEQDKIKQEEIESYQKN